jgi:hypothetical protein
MAITIGRLDAKCARFKYKSWITSKGIGRRTSDSDAVTFAHISRSLGDNVASTGWNNCRTIPNGDSASSAPPLA